MQNVTAACLKRVNEYYVFISECRLKAGAPFYVVMRPAGRAVVTMPTNLETRRTFMLDVALRSAHYLRWIVSLSTIDDKGFLVTSAFVWSGSQQTITSASSLPVAVAVVLKRISSGAALCDYASHLLCMKSCIVIVGHDIVNLSVTVIQKNVMNKWRAWWKNQVSPLFLKTRKLDSKFPNLPDHSFCFKCRIIAKLCTRYTCR